MSETRARKKNHELYGPPGQEPGPDVTVTSGSPVMSASSTPGPRPVARTCHASRPPGWDRHPCPLVALDRSKEPPTPDGPSEAALGQGGGVFRLIRQAGHRAAPDGSGVARRSWSRTVSRTRVAGARRLSVGHGGLDETCRHLQLRLVALAGARLDTSRCSFPRRPFRAMLTSAWERA